jgi:hypothetical protein
MQANILKVFFECAKIDPVMVDTCFSQTSLVSQIIEEVRSLILKWLGRPRICEIGDYQSQHLLHGVPGLVLHFLTSLIALAALSMFFEPMYRKRLNVAGQFLEFRRPAVPGKFSKLHQKGDTP